MIDTTLSKSRILVTGAGSGLGKYIAQRLDCVALIRDNRKEILTKYKTKPFDVIIHCAFNSSKDVRGYYDYVQDNIFLTKDLTLLPHHKFIFISSVDIYREEESSYKTSKLMAESIVENLGSRSLILRCGAILGETMRKNTLLKIAEDEVPETSLSKESTFNYVLQEDILDFIGTAYQNNYNGIVDFVSAGNISLDKVAKLLKKDVEFGSYTYESPAIPNQELVTVFPKAALTSENNIQRFLRNYNNG
jgi:nucleoside-diphosphate-sugar epimerase